MALLGNLQYQLKMVNSKEAKAEIGRRMAEIKKADFATEKERWRQKLRSLLVDAKLDGAMTHDLNELITEKLQALIEQVDSYRA